MESTGCCPIMEKIREEATIVMLGSRLSSWPFLGPCCVWLAFDGGRPSTNHTNRHVLTVVGAATALIDSIDPIRLRVDPRLHPKHMSTRTRRRGSLGSFLTDDRERLFFGSFCSWAMLAKRLRLLTRLDAWGRCGRQTGMSGAPISGHRSPHTLCIDASMLTAAPFPHGSQHRCEPLWVTG